MSYFAFDELSDLVAVCHLCAQRQRPPRRVWELRERDAVRWAVEVTELADDEVRAAAQMTRLCDAMGVRAVLLKTLPAGASERPISDVVRSVWRYRDPLTAGSSRTSAETELQSFDPSDPAIRYLVAADDQTQAGKLLDALLAARQWNVRVLPTRYRSEESRSLFFWLVVPGSHDGDSMVSGDAGLPLLVAEHTKRIWWTRSERVFYQWPYDLLLPRKLEPWLVGSESDGMVLLGKDPPYRMVVSVPRDAMAFQELIAVAKLAPADVAKAVPATRLVAKRAERPLEFPVELTMRPPTHGDELRKRIADLDIEIRSLSDLRDRIRARVSNDRQDDIDDFEPLHMYMGSDADGPLPYELRRLLLEWSDQPEDLRSLRYAKIAPAGLPTGLLVEGTTDVHLLTTAAALGTSGAARNGYRLRDYAPTRGSTFVLDSDWSVYGLRLMLRAGDGLSLYPPFRPNEGTVPKLARALLGDCDPAEWLALLRPAPQRRVSVLAIRRDWFVPLLDAFDWRCRIQVHEAPRATRADAPATSVAESVVDEIAQEARRAVDSVGAKRMREVRDELVAAASERAKEVADARQRLDRQVSRLAEVRSGRSRLLRETRERLNTARAGWEAICSRLAKECERAGVAKADLSDVVDGLALMAGDLERIEEDERTPGGETEEP